MSDSGGVSSGDAGANGVSESDTTLSSAAPTSTDDLREGIAERYSLTPYGTYSSRVQSFGMAVPVQKERKLRKQKPNFVSAAYLRDTVGVSVYQPTGYAIQRDFAGDSKLNDQQFSQTAASPMQDPVGKSFSTQKPMLDRKVSDTKKPEEVGRLKEEKDLRRRAIHVVQGTKDQYDYDYSED
jgi:hypothetical protein